MENRRRANRSYDRTAAETKEQIKQVLTLLYASSHNVWLNDALARFRKQRGRFRGLWHVKVNGSLSITQTRSQFLFVPARGAATSLPPAGTRSSGLK